MGIINTNGFFFPLTGWFTLLNQEGKECAMTLTSMGQVAGKNNFNKRI